MPVYLSETLCTSLPFICGHLIWPIVYIQWKDELVLKNCGLKIHIVGIYVFSRSVICYLINGVADFITNIYKAI